MNAMVIKRNVINQICWYVLLFFGLFDTARNYTYLPYWFGYLKDIIIFVLIIFNLNNIKLNRAPGILFYSMIFVVFTLSIQGFFNSRYNWTSVLIGIIKYLEFFFMILVFLNWDLVFSISISKALQQYVYIGVPILIAINVIGYYIPNPIVSRTIWNGRVAYGFYGGRITVGQPPIAIYPVIMAYVYLLIYDKNLKRLLVYLVAIIMAVSNTGLGAVALAMITIFVYEGIISKDRKLWKKYIHFVMIVALLLVILLPILKEQFPQQWELYQSKIIAFLLGKQAYGITEREVHWISAIQRLNGIADFLFGKGMYGYYDKINFYDTIENMYITIFCSYGWTGFLVWLMFWIMLIYKDIKEMVKKQERNYLLSICIIQIYILHMYTLDTLICYMISFAFSLFYAFAHKKQYE